MKDSFLERKELTKKEKIEWALKRVREQAEFLYRDRLKKN